MAKIFEEDRVRKFGKEVSAVAVLFVMSVFVSALHVVIHRSNHLLAYAAFGFLQVIFVYGLYSGLLSLKYSDVEEALNDLVPTTARRVLFLGWSFSAIVIIIENGMAWNEGLFLCFAFPVLFEIVCAAGLVVGSIAALVVKLIFEHRKSQLS